MNLLSEVKDKLVSKITLQLPLREIDDVTINELSSLVKNNSGDSLLYFEIIKEETNTSIQLFSRPARIRVNKQVIDYLKNKLTIDFKLN